MPRHHDHGHGQLAGACPFLEQRDAVSVGHPDVQQHQVRPQAATDLACLAGILREAHLVSLVAQDLGQQFANPDFVIDDQYLAHLPPCLLMRSSAILAGAAGRMMVMLAPPEGSLQTTILPLCSSTIFLTMARPSPVPFDLVVT